MNKKAEMTTRKLLLVLFMILGAGVLFIGFILWLFPDFRLLLSGRVGGVAGSLASTVSALIVSNTGILLILLAAIFTIGLYVIQSSKKGGGDPATKRLFLLIGVLIVLFLMYMSGLFPASITQFISKATGYVGIVLVFAAAAITLSLYSKQKARKDQGTELLTMLTLLGGVGATLFTAFKYGLLGSAKGTGGAALGAATGAKDTGLAIFKANFIPFWGYFMGFTVPFLAYYGLSMYRGEREPSYKGGRNAMFIAFFLGIGGMVLTSVIGPTLWSTAKLSNIVSVKWAAQTGTGKIVVATLYIFAIGIPFAILWYENKFLKGEAAFQLLGRTGTRLAILYFASWIWTLGGSIPNVTTFFTGMIYFVYWAVFWLLALMSLWGVIGNILSLYTNHIKAGTQRVTAIAEGIRSSATQMATMAQRLAGETRWGEGLAPKFARLQTEIAAVASKIKQASKDVDTDIKAGNIAAEKDKHAKNLQAIFIELSNVGSELATWQDAADKGSITDPNLKGFIKTDAEHIQKLQNELQELQKLVQSEGKDYKEAYDQAQVIVAAMKQFINEYNAQINNAGRKALKGPFSVQVGSNWITLQQLAKKMKFDYSFATPAFKAIIAQGSKGKELTQESVAIITKLFDDMFGTRVGGRVVAPPSPGVAAVAAAAAGSTAGAPAGATAGTRGGLLGRIKGWFGSSPRVAVAPRLGIIQKLSTDPNSNSSIVAVGNRFAKQIIEKIEQIRNADITTEKDKRIQLATQTEKVWESLKDLLADNNIDHEALGLTEGIIQEIDEQFDRGKLGRSMPKIAKVIKYLREVFL